MVDFDTQWTSLMNNQLLCSHCDAHPNLEILLPYQITHSAMVDKLIEYENCNSLIVIDSLNGLLDYFNFYGINGFSNNDKKVVGGFDRTDRWNFTSGKDPHAGYRSLNLIKILFQGHANKQIPVIITFYQSQSSIDRLMFETISKVAFPYQENNHFRRISNLVSLLEYFQDKDDLFMTILKKIPSPVCKTLSGFSNFPHTRKIMKKPEAD
ncbi:MAG: hypothetical protein L0H55_04255 [Candidatus Nitrosocosmicus sp.]|nr:hypothetical protein [Candidatus Nitrosocosmicus sp.]